MMGTGSTVRAAACPGFRAACQRRAIGRQQGASYTRRLLLEHSRTGREQFVTAHTLALPAASRTGAGWGHGSHGAARGLQAAWQSHAPPRGPATLHPELPAEESLGIKSSTSTPRRASELFSQQSRPVPAEARGHRVTPKQTGHRPMLGPTARLPSVLHGAGAHLGLPKSHRRLLCLGAHQLSRANSARLGT